MLMMAVLSFKYHKNLVLSSLTTKQPHFNSKKYC
jgi:hypothetical protein